LFERLPDLHLTRPPRFRGYIFRAPSALECEWSSDGDRDTDTTPAA
jgi:hypothetical protein